MVRSLTCGLRSLFISVRGQPPATGAFCSEPEPSSCVPGIRVSALRALYSADGFCSTYSTQRASSLTCDFPKLRHPLSMPTTYSRSYEHE